MDHQDESGHHDEPEHHDETEHPNEASEGVHLEGWLAHLLYDGDALEASAANPPNPGLIGGPGAPNAPLSETGQWDPLQNWPIEYINALMLPTGKVLGYDRTLNLRLWDPVTNTFTSPADPGYNIFCTGTALLADGTVLVTGGAVVDTFGLPFASIYDPFNDSWTQLSNFNAGRWYPSSTTLSNGDVLVLSGDTNGSITNPLPQVYEAATGTWRDLTTAEQYVSFYPRTFSAPNGAAFVAGPDPLSQYLDVNGTGQWIPVAYRIHPYRDVGSAVMYAPGKILYVGGGGPATDTAEAIDLNEPDPAWRLVADMEFARRNLNATLLPDGEVLVIGGNTGSSLYDGDAILAAEIWNPVTETFRTVASMDDIRWYHSSALLLPDGRVLSTGGDLHLTGQTYSPPYLFQGPRPTISSAPETVRHGDTFFVGTPDAAEITKVRWIRLGTATHAQDWDQYMQEATFSLAAGGLDVTSPPSPNTAPPGYYMLFVVKGEVPSVAKIIKVGPTLSGVSIEDSSVLEGPAASTRDMVFTVSLELASAETVTVAYATANGAALAGQDFVAQSGTVTFAPLQKTQTITVSITGDGAVEDTEAFAVNLSAPVGTVLFDAEAEGLIRDFGSLPLLQIEDTELVEGDSGTTDATFTVTLSEAPTTTPVTVAYTTVDGTALDGQSYVSRNGTLTFNPGVTVQNIVVGVIGDTMDEMNNTFLLRLSDPVGATLDISEAQCLIYNSDDPPTANFMGDVLVAEPATGSATLTLTVTLSAPSGREVVVHWATAANGNAVPGTNFVEQVGKLIFAPGSTTETFTVTILDDGVKTFERWLSVLMQSELINANYGNRYTRATILDTDGLPAISLSRASTVEGAAGTTGVVFTATLTADMPQDVTVAYATSAGTATADVDYTETFGTITFAPGTLTRPITVLAQGDAAAESNETFNLVLSNPVNATLAGGKSVGTIIDDDGAPVPAAPTNLAAVAGFGSVALTWQASAGATSYRVYRGTSSNGEGTTPVATGVVGTQFVDQGLVNGSTYYYWVTPVAGPFEGSASAEVAITPTSYDFSAGFSGRSLDPTVQNAEGSGAVLSLNGLNVHNVRLFGATLQLTDGGTNQTDSVFTRNRVDVTRFTTHFNFQQLPSHGYVDPLADGMTFTIQGVGPTATGGPGGGLGYASIDNSVAVKFDLFDNSGEGANSTGLFTSGNPPEALNSIDLTGTGIDLHSGHEFAVSMTYDGTTLEVTITDTVTLAAATQSYTVDIPAIVGGNAAYVGFTGGTGGLTAVQKINSWIFTPAPAAPTNLQVTAASAVQVNLSWTNVDPNASGVIIERKTGPGGTYLQIGMTAFPTANTFTDPTVAAETTYFYRVRAVNGDSTSEHSNEIDVTTPAPFMPAINFPNGFAGAEGEFSFNGPSAAIVGT
ncbi:MAG: Calx-beta domain-containing protein, partial [Pirellulales bacterium]